MPDASKSLVIRAEKPAAKPVVVDEVEETTEAPEAIEVDPPLLFPEAVVSLALHQRCCDIFGVAVYKPSLSDLSQQLENGDLPAEEWWATFGKNKTLQQWKTKLVRLGSSGVLPDSVPELLPELLRHMLASGRWS